MTKWKETMAMRLFGLMKIPLLFLVAPRIVESNEKRCEVVIPLNRLTRNHVNSMYFAVLAMGADLAGGVILMDAIKRSKKKIGFIFKDFSADFLKRTTADAHFICEEGDKVQALIHKAIKSKKRENTTVNIFATTPSKTGDEPVVKFTLTLSVKLEK